MFVVNTVAPPTDHMMSSTVHAASLASFLASHTGRHYIIVVSTSTMGHMFPAEVECRTRGRESPGSNTPFATVSKFGHFRSLHDAPVN